MKTRTGMARLVAITCAALLAGLALVTATSAQVSPNHDLSWHVVAGGGAPMAAAGRQVNGTLGQLAIGPAVASEHTLGSGYWYGIRWEEEGYRIYLPAVARGG